MHCSCDHHYRQNPLKEKVWKERLKELTDLGADPEKLKQIVENFNTQQNDSTHALYILDWYRARLVLENYTGSDQQLQLLSRYYSRYKLDDYHDLSLDGQLQIEYFDTFLHYAQLAQTQYVFRRYPWDSIQPSSLIEHLKNRENSAEVNLYYRPKYHETLIQFPNGWSWVLMRPEDKESEASSLDDCASPEGGQSIIVSLRQPLEDGYYQTRLRAQLTLPNSVKVPHQYAYQERRPEGVTYDEWEASYPRRHREAVTLELAKTTPSLLVQLRSYHNHKPGTPIGMQEDGSECWKCKNLNPGDRARIELSKEEGLPYIMALLAQPWVVWVLKPNYRAEETFLLGDLPQELRGKLYQQKPWMFNIRSFNRRYPISNYGDRLNDVFTPTPTPTQIVKDLHKGKTAGFKKRLEAGIKYQRHQLFQVIEDVLLRTKNKGAINQLLKLLDELPQYKQTRRIAFKFFQTRLEWLFQNFNFLTRTLGLVTKDSLRSYGNNSYLGGPVYLALKKHLLANPNDSLVFFKALFEQRIAATYYEASSQESSLELKRKKNYEKSSLYMADLLTLVIGKIEYTTELQEWMGRRPLPYGNWETRHFINDWAATPSLLRQLNKLYGGLPVDRDVAGKILKAQSIQLRQAASIGTPTIKKLSRQLIDAIYRNIYSSDDDIRRQTGDLLQGISRRRLRRRLR